MFQDLNAIALKFAKRDVLSLLNIVEDKIGIDYGFDHSLDAVFIKHPQCQIGVLRDQLGSLNDYNLMIVSLDYYLDKAEQYSLITDNKFPNIQEPNLDKMCEHLGTQLMILEKRNRECIGDSYNRPRSDIQSINYIISKERSLT